jgi:hypothetical protein
MPAMLVVIERADEVRKTARFQMAQTTVSVPLILRATSVMTNCTRAEIPANILGTMNVTEA